MRVSKINLNKNLENELIKLFFQLVADLKTPKEVKVTLEEILTKGELLAIVKRMAVAYYLQCGRSYQNIQNNLKVSSSTVAAVDKKRTSEGYQIALKKIEADQWATEWAQKIERFIKRK